MFSCEVIFGPIDGRFDIKEERGAVLISELESALLKAFIGASFSTGLAGLILGDGATVTGGLGTVLGAEAVVAIGTTTETIFSTVFVSFSLITVFS